METHHNKDQLVDKPQGNPIKEDPIFEPLEQLIHDTRYPLASHPVQQTTFLRLLQRGIEEKKDLGRLASVIDAALVPTTSYSSLLPVWWSQPSEFQRSLQRYQKQIELLQPKAVPKLSQRPRRQRTYGIADAASTASSELDTSSSDGENLADEKTHLLVTSPKEPQKTAKEKTEKEKPEHENTIRSKLADDNYVAYQRLMIGYRTRPTGILDLEKASDHLLAAALYGHADAQKEFRLLPSDPLTVFNRAVHQEAWFSAQLKSITLHESLYSQAQWRLFLLVYSHRYQQGIYADYETRFAELQQAVTYLHTYMMNTPRPEATLAAVAEAFLVPHLETEQTIRQSAWSILQKEIQGQDPLVDWYQRSLKKKSDTTLETVYPFRILPAKAVITFCEKHPDQIPIAYQSIINETKHANQKSFFQLQTVEINAKGEYVLTIGKDIGTSLRPQTIVFFDTAKETEIARIICDGKRFLLHAYGDAIQLMLPADFPCLYYKIHNPSGTFILQATLSEAVQYLEIQATHCIIPVDSACQAKLLKIEADTTEQYGLLKADTLQLHTTQMLSNHKTGQIQAIYQLRLTGGSVWNAGKITTTGKGVISLNHVFFHGMGSLELLQQAVAQKKWPGGAIIEGGDFSIIAGAYVNLFSAVKVRHGSLMVLIEINLGLGVTVNTTKSRLFAVDIGIDIPHFPQMINDIVPIIKLCAKGCFAEAFHSLDKAEKFRFMVNSVSVARWMIRTFIPAAGKITDTTWTAVMLAMSMPGLYQQCQELYQKSKQGKPIEPRDVYGLIALAGSVTNQIFFLVTQVEGMLPSDDSSEAQNNQAYWQWPNQTNSMLVLNVLALFAPNQTDDALVKLKSGIHVTGSLLDRSLTTFGIGHTAIALNVSNLFFYSIQYGTVQVANNISESGQLLVKKHGVVTASNHYTDVNNQHTGERMYVDQLLWQTQDYDDSSMITAEQVTFKSQHQGIHHGHLTADVVVIEGSEVTLTQESQTHGDAIQVTGKHLHHQGETHGQQIALNASATIEDSGHIVADTIEYHVQEKMTHLSGALLEAKAVLVDGGQGEVLEQGKISISSNPLVAQPKAAPTATSEDASPLSAALSMKAKSITLAAESEIDAKAQTGLIQATEQVEAAGHLLLDNLELSAGVNMQLRETAAISVSGLLAKAPTLSQSSHIQIIPKPLNEVVVSNTKTADVDLEGTDSLTQTAQGRIDASGAAVLFKSEHTISDAGQITAQAVDFNAVDKVERLVTASLEANSVDMGTLTSETVDQGRVLLHSSSTTSTEKLTTASLTSAVVRGKQVTLGEGYQLTAKDQRVEVHAEESLNIQGALTADELQLSAKEKALFGEQGQMTVHHLVANAEQITQESQIRIEKKTDYFASDKSDSDKKTVPTPDLSLHGSERVEQSNHGRIEAAYASVLLSSENEIVDAGFTRSSQLWLQGNQKVERTTTAVSEVGQVLVGLEETGQTIDNGQITLTSDALLQNPSDNQLTAAVTIQGKSVLLGATQTITAPNETISVSSGSNLTAQGHITTQAISLTAKENVKLSDMADIAAKAIDVIAPTIMQRGVLTVTKTTDAPRTAVDKNRKTIEIADLSLQGSQQVIQEDTGQITGEHAVVSFSSANEVIDKGQLTVKKAFLAAGTRIERTDTAHTTAQYLQLSQTDNPTLEIVDQGHMTQVLPTASENEADAAKTLLHPALVANAKRITLGDTHELIAEVGSAQFRASETLLMSEKAQQMVEHVTYEAPQASVKGKVEAGTITYRVDQTDNAGVQSLLTQRGDFKQWQPKKKLEIETTQPIQLHDTYEFPYSVALTAPTLHVQGNIHSSHDVNLTSTAGDLVVEQTSLVADQQLLFNTSESFRVTESHLKGNETQVVATQDIINQHATIEAQTFLNLKATGNIENHCAETTYWGGYSNRIRYLPAQLLGGTGIGYNGIGLDVQAGGRFILDSSEVVSAGSNQIVAEGQDTQKILPPDVSGIEKQLAALKRLDQDSVGVSLQVLKNQLLEKERNIPPTVINEAAITTTARSHQYTSFERHDDHWYGDHDHVEKDWDYQASVIHSTGGNNAVQSSHGSIDATATDFIAPGQTSLIALGKDVVLRELVLSHQDFRDSSNIITDSPSYHYDEYGRLTRIVSMAGVDIYAVNDIRLEGAQIISLGKVKLEAEGDIVILAPILNHSMNSESMSAAVQIPTCPPISLVGVYNDARALFSTPAFQSYQGGTPTNSGQNTAVTAANIWNLSIDSLNAFSGVMSGLRAGSPISTIFPASSMVVVQLTVSDTRTETHWQTVDPSAGIFADSIELHTKHGIGVSATLQAREGLLFDGDTLTLRGNAVSASTETDTVGFSIGITAGGDPVGGIQYSHSSGSGMTYINQQTQAKTVTFHVREAHLYNTTIQAETVEGHIDYLEIKSDCSTWKSNGQSFTADTTGNVSGQLTQTDSAMINQVTSITSENSTLSIGTGEFTGAILKVTGENHIQIDHVITHTILEHNEGSVEGLCVNLQDLGGQGNRPFAQAIPNATVQYGRGDFRAEQQSVVTGTAPQAGLDSSGGDGQHITHDSQYNISVRIPFYNKAGLKQLEDNLQYTEDMLSTAFHSQTAPVPETKVIPVSHADQNSSSTSAHTSQETKTSSTTGDSPTTTTSSSDDYSGNEGGNVVAKAEQTLAAVDKVTHEPLILVSPHKPIQTGLRQYGIWGEMAVRDIQARAEKAAQRHSNENGLTPNDAPIASTAAQGSTSSMNLLMQKLAEQERAPEGKSQDEWKQFWEDPITQDMVKIVSMIPAGRAASAVLRVGESIATAGKVAPLLEKAGMWGKAERDVPHDDVSLTPHEQLTGALSESKVAEQLDGIDASSVIASKALHNKYEGLVKFQSKEEGTELLPDGRILYYDKFREAKTEGATIGSRFVTEYNPATGHMKMWNEMYDQAGSVNRVHIKSIDGVKIDAPHFPLTLQERLTQEMGFHL